MITIDGPAGSGKSTTARLVAKRLGYVYLDTGAMYRAMTLKALRSGVDPANDRSLEQMAERTSITVKTDPEGTRVILDGEDVTESLRDPEVSRKSSMVAAVKAVRERMVELQRQVGARGGIVAEGRDIGSVVFPDAEVKIYLEADLKCRALRRKRDLDRAGETMQVDRIVEDLAARDEYDSSREHSPLVVPESAVTIDTTHLTIEQQVQRVLEEVKARVGEDDLEISL